MLQNSRTWKIREQIIDDPLSGLVLEFRVVEKSAAPYRLRIYAPDDVMRELSFDRVGYRDEAGVHAERISRLNELVRRTRDRVAMRRNALLHPLARRLLSRLMVTTRMRRRLARHAGDDRPRDGDRL